MARALTVSIDAMGGDAGPSVVVSALLKAVQRHTDVGFLLHGDEAGLAPLLARQPRLLGRVTIVHAAERVRMEDKPSHVLRRGKDTSMWHAIDSVKRGEASVAVSAGNTGALMAISRFVLKTLPGIDRPAIATMLPTLQGHTHILDLGANVDCTAEHLLQFGIMGAELVASVEHKTRPTVGLLNIGEEDIKGNEVVKEAAVLLRASDLNFHGNIENIYQGATDVVVCDGFVGNVALKTSEGLAQMLGTYLREEFSRNLFTKLLGLVAMPVIKAFKKRVDHRRYNGASLLGLRGIVIKSHGSADVFAFGFAIEHAINEVRTGVLTHISERMAALEQKVLSA